MGPSNTGGCSIKLDKFFKRKSHLSNLVVSSVTDFLNLGSSTRINSREAGSYSIVFSMDRCRQWRQRRSEEAGTCRRLYRQESIHHLIAWYNKASVGRIPLLLPVAFQSETVHPSHLYIGDRMRYPGTFCIPLTLYRPV